MVGGLGSHSVVGGLGSPESTLHGLQAAASPQISLPSHRPIYITSGRGLLNLMCLGNFLILVSFLYSLRHESPSTFQERIFLQPGGNSKLIDRQVCATDRQAKPSESHPRPCSKADPCAGNGREAQHPSLAPPNPASLPLPPDFPSGHLAYPRGV